MPGGEVLVDAKRDGVYLTGTAYKVCEGIYMKWGWNKCRFGRSNATKGVGRKRFSDQ